MDIKKTNTPYSTSLKNISEIKNFLGKEVGLSNWVKITQEDINTFAKLTDDEQWIHVDVARAKNESPYGRTIAHGFMILSLASKFCYECFYVEDIVMGVNYGLNKVRFINATKSDDEVRGRISLLDYEPIPNGAKYIMNITFEIKGESKPACIAEFIAQVYSK